MCLHVNRTAHAASYVNGLIETEGLLKDAGSHVHSKSGNISETVQHCDDVTTDH